MKKKSWSSNGDTRVFSTKFLVLSLVCLSIFLTVVNFNDSFFFSFPEEELTTTFSIPKTSQTSNLISEQLSILDNSELIINQSYAFSGLFHDSSDYETEFTDAKLQTQYEGFDTIYNDTITPVYNLNETYPTSFNKGIVKNQKVINSTGDLQTQNNDYYEFVSESDEAEYYIDSCDFNDEEDETLGTDIKFITEFNSGDGATGNSKVLIKNNYNNHKKVLLTWDNWNGEETSWEHSQSTSHASGTIEFWFLLTIATKTILLAFQNSSVSSFFYFRTSGGNFQFTNTSGWNWITLTSFTGDQWYHFKIDFEQSNGNYTGLDINTYRIYINNHDYGILNSGASGGFQAFFCTTLDAEASVSAYFDSFAFSWEIYDNILSIGDNTNPEDPLGHFNGTNSFRSDPVTLTSTNDISFVDYDDSAINTSASIISSFNSHTKVLDIYDNNNTLFTTPEARALIQNNFSDNQESGSIEFWFATSDITYSSFIYVRESETTQIRFRFDGLGQFQVYDGSWIDTNMTVLNDTWYHIRFDFRCVGAGAYLGLAEDSWKLYINGTYIDIGETLDFMGNPTYLNNLQLQSQTEGINYHNYYDAFGYTWENYTIGDNNNTDIYTLDFNFEIDFTETNYPLAIKINAYWNTSISQNITIYLYNFTGTSWDLFNNSIFYPSQTLSIIRINNISISDYTNGSIIRVRVFGENATNPFILMMDQFQMNVIHKLSITHSKSFSHLGIWRYRFFLSGSSYYSDWINFEVIGINNIEIISESEFYTKWQFVESNATGINLYNDTFTSYGNWSSSLSGNFTTDDPSKFVGIYTTDIDAFNYAESFNISSIVSDPVDIQYFNGSWYVLNNDDSCVYQFNLDWSYANQFYNLSSYGTDYHGFDYSNIEDRWYIVDNADNRGDQFYNDLSYQNSPFATYNAETPRDVEIISGLFSGIFFILDNDEIQTWIGGMPSGTKSLASVDTDCRGFTVGTANTLYIAGNTNDSIHKFTTSGTSITYNTSFDISEQTTSPYAIEFYQNDWWILGNSEKMIYQYHPTNTYNKTGIDTSNAIYVQSNISELATTLESPVLNLTLEEGDQINLNYKTTSTELIDLNLYSNGEIVFTRRLIPENNDNFDNQTTILVPSFQLEFDKIEFVGNIDAESYFLLYSISIDRFNITQTVYLDPDGIKLLFLDFPIPYYAFVFEKDLLVEQFEFTSSADLQVLIFEKIYAELVYFTYYDINNEYLDFRRFTMYVNYSYGGEPVYDERLAEYYLSCDTNTLIYYRIFDSFEVIIETGSITATRFIDITLDVYSLKILNKAFEKIEYNLTNIDSNIDKIGFLFPNEIKEFSIASGNYSLNYTNFEDNQIRIYDFTFTGYKLIIINTTTFEVYFSIFNFDGLGLSNEIVRLYINSERKDFGFNTLLQDSNRLTITDYFNETISDSLVNLRQYTEYDILVEVYTLILNNNYTHSIYIEIERNDIELKQIIPSQSSISLRFLPDIKYTITYSYINGTEIGEIEIKLDKNNKIVSFGFYSVAVPISPLPILNSVQLLIWFGFIIMGITIVVIVLYFRIKGREPKISDELRAILLQQSKKRKKTKKKAIKVSDDRDIYINT